MSNIYNFHVRYTTQRSISLDIDSPDMPELGLKPAGPELPSEETSRVQFIAGWIKNSCTPDDNPDLLDDYTNDDIINVAVVAEKVVESEEEKD